MPPKPNYYHELEALVRLLDERVEGLRHETGELKTAADDLRENMGKDRREMAISNERLETQIKRLDEWDRRLWGLVALVFGALLSLACGLIVTLATR